MTLKKINIILCLCVALILSGNDCHAQARIVDRFPDNFKKLDYIQGDYGDYVWGVPKSAVKDLEYKKRTPLVDDLEEALFYQISFMGRKSSISYEFEKNEKFNFMSLTRGQINVYQTFPDPQEWLDFLIDVQLELEKEFGEPVREEFVWKKTDRKAFPKEWRYALFDGDMEAYTDYVKGRTMVKVVLKLERRFKPHLVISYEQIDAQKAPKKEEQMQPLNLPGTAKKEADALSNSSQSELNSKESSDESGLSDILLP